MRDYHATWMGIVALSQLGAITRVVMQQIAKADEQNESSVLWANFVGTLLLGFANTCKPQMDRAGITPLFYAVTAGFCGALTSFSTWMFEVVRWAVAWPQPVVINDGLSVLRMHNRALSVASGLLVDLGVAYMGYEMGRVCGQPYANQKEQDAEAAPLVGKARPNLRTQQTVLVRTMTDCNYMHGNQELDPPPSVRRRLLAGVVENAVVMQLAAFALCSTAVTLGAAGGAAFGRTSEAMLFTVLFAPLGSLLRYWLGIRLNAWPEHFRLGTFIANFVACGIAVATVVAQAHGDCFKAHPWTEGALKGVISGFCGALSTMSTFVAQLHEMDRVHAPMYAILSCGAALLMMCLALWTYLFFSGWPAQVCV